MVIPDAQQKAGVPNIHLEWIGQYIADEFGGRPDVTVVNIGDFWDMPSLSSYDKGHASMEGRRYVKDIDSGNIAFRLLDGPLKKHKKFRKVFLDGNHEHRVTRAQESDAQVEGLLSLDHMDTRGWERHGFLEPVWIDDICYSHYFANPMTGRPYGGSNLETRLKTVGHSFTMGHQQGFKYAEYNTLRGVHHAIVAGSCYLHDEDYLGPQCVNYWRGIVVCHGAEKGQYDIEKVSLRLLCKRYEGKTLAQLKWRK